MMESLSNCIMAIDIGTTKIAAIIGTIMPNGVVEVKAKAWHESQGVHRGTVENVEETTQSIKKCLAQLYASTNLRPREAVVGIAGQHITSLQNAPRHIRDNAEKFITEAELENMTKKMHKIGLEPGREILHITPQEYLIDDIPAPRPVGMMGSSLSCNYHIVLAEAASIRKIKMCIENAGLKVRDIVLEPFASAEAVLINTEREEGVAILDIGGGTSDLVIYQNNILRSTAVIPCGGEIITNDIRETCSINRFAAEDIKRAYGACFVNQKVGDDRLTFTTGLGRAPKSIKLRTLSEIICSRMDEIIEAVDYKIHEIGCGNSLKSIVLTGGGSLLKGVTELVKLRTGFDARIGYPRMQDINMNFAKHVSPALATCIGLVLYEHNSMSNKSPKSSRLNLLKDSNLVKGLWGKLDKMFTAEGDIPFN
ncbi:MAG: cell division protein FtsA [Bacteroidales bacterium]